MPSITLEIATLEKEKKAALVKEIAAAAARITELPEEAFYIFIKENHPDNVAIGGTLLSDRKK